MAALAVLLFLLCCQLASGSFASSAQTARGQQVQGTSELSTVLLCYETSVEVDR